MSIISTFEAVPSRLFALYATLFNNEHGEVKERIEAWATPPSLSGRTRDDGSESSTNLFSATLSEARKIGFVEEIDNKLRLTDEARGGGKKGDDSEAYFLAYMRDILFDPTRATEAQQTGFMIALSWFLDSNPLHLMNFSEPPQTRVREKVGDYLPETELTTLSRYQNFLYWARYLGFATIIGGVNEDDLASRHVIPNPLNAIESALPLIFSESRDLSIEQFMTRLAAIFPVFETGSVRKSFEGMLLKPLDDSDKRLSITTSLALQRLVDRQCLTLTGVADAASRILDLGLREERVSRVILRSAE